MYFKYMSATKKFLTQLNGIKLKLEEVNLGYMVKYSSVHGGCLGSKRR